MFKYMITECSGKQMSPKNIAKNKVAEVDEISAELFKILPDDSVEKYSTYSL